MHPHFAAFTPRARFGFLKLSAGKDYIEGGFQTPLAGRYRHHMAQSCNKLNLIFCKCRNIAVFH
jgi:hypothetical protein